MLERAIEVRLRSAVARLGGRAYKWVSPGTAGVPDRIVLLPGGRAVFVELKAPGKRLREIQKKRIKELRALGFAVYVLDSVQAVDNFVVEATKNREGKEMTFTEWLKNQPKRRGYLGDFIYDVCHDPRWPSNGETLEEFQFYLRTRHACREAVYALKKLWREYREEVDSNES